MKAQSKRIAFIFLGVLAFLFEQKKNKVAYFDFMRKLVKPIKKYKIQKSVSRAIARRLKRAGMPISPELLDRLSDYDL